MRHSVLLSILMAVSMPALAIYKCESHGRITYSDQACGAAQSELPPPAPAADPAGARRQAASERSRLSQIEKEQDKAQERSLRQQRLRGNDKTALAQQKKCRLLALEKKWSAEDAASMPHTISDKTAGLRKQARRKAERYDAECVH